MLAEGPPSWERDRNARCEREIRKASAELVELMVTKHRKAVKLLDKRCARYTSEWQARQGRNSATTEITSREATPPKP